MAQRVKRLPAMQETWVRTLGQEDPLEKAMAPHSSTLAWKIPWTEEPGRLQTMASQRVGHDWATSLHVTSCNSAFSTVLSTHLCAYTCHFIQFFDTCKHLTLRYSAQNVGSKYQAVPKISTFGCCSVAQLCPNLQSWNAAQTQHSRPHCPLSP